MFHFLSYHNIPWWYTVDAHGTNCIQHQDVPKTYSHQNHCSRLQLAWTILLWMRVVLWVSRSSGCCIVELWNSWFLLSFRFGRTRTCSAWRPCWAPWHVLIQYDHHLHSHYFSYVYLFFSLLVFGSVYLVSKYMNVNRLIQIQNCNIERYFQENLHKTSLPQKTLNWVQESLPTVEIEKNYPQVLRLQEQISQEWTFGQHLGRLIQEEWEPQTTNHLNSANTISVHFLTHSVHRRSSPQAEKRLWFSEVLLF